MPDAPEEGYLDTNVLVHELTGRPREPAERARYLFERAERGECRLIVTAPVVAEVVYVLTGSVFRQPRQIVADALLRLLRLPGVACSDEEAILAALLAFRRENVDFVDAFLWGMAKVSGVKRVFTFNRRDFEGRGIDVRC